MMRNIDEEWNPLETNGKAMAYEGPKMLSKGRALEEHEGFQM
jgi:hypothetical protein